MQSLLFMELYVSGFREHVGFRNINVYAEIKGACGIT